MIVLWIFGILALLIVWLCLTRVGVKVAFSDGSITADIKIGLFHVRVFPAKEEKKKKDKQREKPAADSEKKGKKRFPKIKLTDIKDAVRTLWPPLKRALDRARRGIRFDPLYVNLTLGGAKDPAATAELYGYLQAGIWTGMPILENVLDIPDPYIHIGMDFNSPDLVLKGNVGVTARIGTLLAVALGVAFPALQWLLKFQKKTKQQKSAPQPTA